MSTTAAAAGKLNNTNLESRDHLLSPIAKRISSKYN